LPAEQLLPEHAVADSLSAVRPAAVWVEAQAAAAALPDDLMHDLQVCLEEALANLIMHGRTRRGEKDIRIAVRATPGEAEIIVRDACAPFDVTDASVAEPQTEGRIGGQGLRLLRAFATELAYRSEPAFNELRMTFRSGAATAGAALSDLIRGVPAFSALSSAALQKLAQAAEHCTYQPSDILLAEGVPSTFALLLVRGEVAVVNQSARGDVPLARITAPALIGEIGALAGLRRTAGVRAVSVVEALKIDRDALLIAGRDAPDMLVSVIGQLGQQIHNINGAIGLYAAGLGALENDALDPALLGDLNNPTAELANFADAFRGLARRVTLERRTRGEMASAALIQAALLPKPIPAAALAGRCDVHGAMKPARQVGGDLFDIAMLDDRRLALVIGDICGKGVPAALFMSATATALRIAARRAESLSELVGQANEALCVNNDMAMFTTLFYGLLDLDSRRLEYVNCGHNPPLLLRHNGVVELAGAAPPLGMFATHTWTSNAIDLEPGEGVFLFTDGVTECIDAAGQEFTDARLAEILARTWRNANAETLVSTVIAEVEAFATGQEQFDDVTCVAALLR
jgi:sigma-B regulation protein RsbU (phosphoserine phosphatase)